MAKKQYLDLAGLTTYDEQIKAYIDGEIDAMPSDVMVVNITSTNDVYSTDKTYGEILEAYESGKLVVAKNFSDNCWYNYYLYAIDDGSAVFESIEFGKSGAIRNVFMVLPSGFVARLYSNFDQEQITTKNTNSTLTTTDKTIVGAINELNTELDSHTHDDRYYTEAEVDTKLSAVNTSITNITNGSTAVKNAEHATSADTAARADTASSATSATKATQDASGNVITSTYETKTDASAKLEEAKAYADTAATTVKNDLLNGAGAAYDTLKELGDLIDDNKDAIDALEAVASGKADKEHSHEIADVNGLQAALDEVTAKADESDVFIVQGTWNNDNGSYTTDKTNAEAYEAYESGKSVIIDLGGDIFLPLAFNSRISMFHSYSAITNAMFIAYFEDNIVDKEAIALQTKSDNSLKTTNKTIAGAINELDSELNSHVTNLQSSLDAKAAQSSLDSHTGNGDIHVTAAQKTNWTAAYTHSTSAHAPTNAQANVIETIKVNGTALTPTSKTVNITVPTDYLVDADIANKADKSTTLAGYGITNAYTKTEVDNKLSVKAAQSDLDSVSSVANEAKAASAANTQSITAHTSSINTHTSQISALQGLVGEGIEAIPTASITALFA